MATACRSRAGSWPASTRAWRRYCRGRPCWNSIKLLDDSDEPVRLAIGASQVRFSFGGDRDRLEDRRGEVSRLPEGDPERAPQRGRDRPRDARAVAQSRGDPVEREDPRRALVFTKNALSIICTNTEQEEAEEGLAIDYDGDPIDIGFNIAYLLDVLNHVDARDRSLCAMGDSNSQRTGPDPGQTTISSTSSCRCASRHPRHCPSPRTRKTQ